MYRHAATAYTFGYWTDWVLTRDVCLHSGGQPGWTCGFNSWGPFKPEVDD
jgi:hypothetical protein